MNPSLRGHVVLVTGAASGIGAAGAAELLRRGAVPVLVDQDAPGLTRQADAFAQGGLERPLTVVCDVTSLAACEAAVQAALQRHGRLDMVWANAGMAAFGPLAHTDPAAWRRCIEVNVMGSFHTVRAALPAVTAARGYVCLTASVSSFAHPPMMSAYAASKGGVAALTLPAARDLARSGIRVMCIAPGVFETPMMAGMPQEVRDSLAANVPFPPRLGRPDEYAALVRHIVENAMVNGEVIRLDGALRMAAK